MDQLIPVCGFMCLYPMLVGALPMWLWMRYGRRLRISFEEEEKQRLAERRAPVGGYAPRKGS